MSVSRFHVALVLGLLGACSAASTLAAVKRSVIPIGRAQGRGDRSPLEGQQVIVEGVVTGQFIEGLGGFFLQDAGDGDGGTSDALFVVPAKALRTRLRTGERRCTAWCPRIRRRQVGGNSDHLQAGS